VVRRAVICIHLHQTVDDQEGSNMLSAVNFSPNKLT
jgi:hypothetical protein